MKENKEQMKLFRQYGLSYEAIGKIYGISRQRVHALIPGVPRGELNIRELAKLLDSTKSPGKPVL